MSVELGMICLSFTSVMNSILIIVLVFQIDKLKKQVKP